MLTGTWKARRVGSNRETNSSSSLQTVVVMSSFLVQTFVLPRCRRAVVGNNGARVSGLRDCMYSSKLCIRFVVDTPTGEASQALEARLTSSCRWPRCRSASPRRKSSTTYVNDTKTPQSLSLPYTPNLWSLLPLYPRSKTFFSTMRSSKSPNYSRPSTEP